MWIPTKISGRDFMSFAEFSFEFQQKCFVLTGSNLDNSSQVSNGSGKTSFSDSIAVALLGYSLSGRNVKDTIRWDSDASFFTVSLELDNQQLKQTCVISRKIYSNTRSQELTILINGQVPSALPSKKGVVDGVDLKLGNQYILQEILDLTEDNLLSHYLISKAHYRPFLHLNTQDKLAVIAKFAQTKPVDLVLAKLDSNQVDAEQFLVEGRQKISETEGYLKALEEQLSEEAENSFHEAKEEEVVRHTRELQDSVQAMTDKQAELQATTDKLSELEVELANLTQDTTLDSLKDQVTEIALVQKEIGKSRHDLQVKINAANVYLAGVVTCPSCGQQFNPEVKTPTENIQVLKDSLAQVVTQDSEVISLLREVEGNLRTSENLISSLNHEIKLCKRSQVELNRQAQGLIQQHERLQDFLETAQARTFAEAKVDVLTKIQEKQDDLDSLRNQLLRDQQQLDHVKLWQERFLDFKFYVGNQPLEQVCQLVNQYLLLAGSDLNLQIENFKKLRSGELRQSLEPIVYRNWQNPYPLVQYSAGEQVRVHLAVDLPFQDLLNQASKTGGLDLYVSDELISELDSAGVSSIAKSFNQVGKTILLTTHSGSDLVYENTIKIQKQDKISKII